MANLAQTLRRRREQLGLTRYALAKVARLKWEAIAQYEAGKRLPRAKTVEALELTLLVLESEQDPPPDSACRCPLVVEVVKKIATALLLIGAYPI
jgi:predicted transcriptional regulator